jgi:phospholipase/lecithinase/hemolysin
MAAVHSDLISKGALHVLILNALDVLKTPVFQYELSTMSAANQAGMRAAAQAWITAYNTELNAKAAQWGGKVVVFDLYASFNSQYAHPLHYGIVNVDSTVCTQTYRRSINGTANLVTAGSDVLVAPEVRYTCNDRTASSIEPPEGAKGTHWWTKYLFADNFHPTPYVHHLLSKSLTTALAVR